MNEVQTALFAMQDPAYRDFHSRLMPTIDKARIIGVRTPALRQYAKTFAKTDEAAAFLRELPHVYYEENNLHGFLIAEMKEFGAAVAALDEFLPYVDNWATCDMLRPKVFKKHTEALLPKIREWMASGQEYTVRFGIEMLMCYYLDEAFFPASLDWVAAARGEDYYIKMMVSWYFATALAKQWEAALPYLTGCRLEIWTHNKTIQKAVESYRITPEQKTYLRTLRRKEGA